MQKFLVGVVTVLGIGLVCATTDARPKARAKKVPAGASSSSSSGSGSATPAPVPSPVAASWSLEEQEQWDLLQAEMDDAVKKLNARCGSKVVGRFDRESFRGHLSSDNGRYGLDTYARAHCLAAATGVENICMVVNEDTAGAKRASSAVTSKVATVECKWGGKGAGGMAFSDKKLTLSIDTDGDNASGVEGKVTGFVKKKL